MRVLKEDEKIKKLNSEITIINSEILRFTNKQIISVVLYGSYGRGEGAFFLDAENNIRTYNDFDLVLVVNELLDQSIINKITIELNKKLDVKWIDISQKTKKKLRELKLTIFNFDLKNGSRVIYGDKNILDNIPDYNSANLSLKEAETLYFTRIWAFLGSLPVDGFERELKGEEVRFFRNQMAKAILAVVDVLLLQKKYYNSSYKKRCKKVIEIFNDKTNFIKWTKWAIEEKCNPKDKIISVSELKEMYLEITNLFLKEMYNVLSIYYNKKITGPYTVKKSVLFSTSEWLILLKSVVKTRSFKYIQQTKVKIAQSYLVDAFLREGKEKENLIKKSRELIKKLNNSEDIDNLNWNELRLLIAKLRMDI
ncbi:hypothetical protein [Thalassobellus citreus]|uniref:hypothetical protein n=1 Tax=Thalassobellus citreus TaxID=3367752 RepID=UPI00378EA5E0